MEAHVGDLVTVKRTGEPGTIIESEKTLRGTPIFKVRLEAGPDQGKVVELRPSQVEIENRTEENEMALHATVDENGKEIFEKKEPAEEFEITLRTEEEDAAKQAKAEEKALKDAAKAAAKAKRDAEKAIRDAEKAKAKEEHAALAAERKAKAEATKLEREAAAALRKQKQEERRNAELNGEKIPSKKRRSLPFGLSMEPAVEGEGLCECGCGEKPLGKKGRFLPGHDARLKGRLIRLSEWLEENGEKIESGEMNPETDFAEYRAIPQSAIASMTTCTCCGQIMMPHESGMGPVCRAGLCKCAERAAGAA